MYSSRLVHSAVLCVVLAGAVTACGSSKGTSSQAAAPGSASQSGSNLSALSASQVLDQAKAAMGSLSSMHAKGYVTTDSDKITLDLSAGKNKDCTGTVSSASDGSMQIIHTSAGTWMKPDATFLQNIASHENSKAGAAAVQLFQGRWLTGGQDDPDLQSMAAMCDLMANMADDDSKQTGATKGSATTVNGTPALTVQVSDDSGPSTVYVATQGQPYLLRMENKGSDGGSVDFSDFNKPLNIQAPPADQVIDFSVFQQKVKASV
ncbi:hypothetical protein LN042_07630 [Kitasatospora sp. RB6PN24]|uniref:hypothetical protein n=1 Tax=Kitasatospora humi TaxID=2893891 RepID=UPI001E50E792|nr:hypothetical protein [Kitasatospora humi]MCC9306978.1 hypothetical protein [Kitasatospora humi]